MTTKRRFAFFDVDGTLISLKSTLSFQDFWLTSEADPAQRAAFEAHFAQLLRDGAPREALNRAFYGHFAGRPVELVKARAAAWFAHHDNDDLWYRPVIQLLQALRNDGIEPVFVSGSFPAVLAPIAERLGVQHVLAANLETADGRYTGTLLPPQTIGDGKAVAMAAFMAANDAEPAACHAFGDDISDLPMLEAVGNPVVVHGDPDLEALARDRGWPSIAPMAA